MQAGLRAEQEQREMMQTKFEEEQKAWMELAKEFDHFQHTYQ